MLEEFSKIVGKENVLTESLEGFLIDQRARFVGKTRAVVLPKSTKEVAQILKICAEKNIPVVPQGGNTNHCGAATPFLEHSIVLNLKRMNQIVETNEENFSMTVEAGATLQSVQEAAFQKNCLFPLSLASEGSCQIGGNLSTNAGGVKVLKYGTMRDLCLGLEVVLPNGEVLNELKTLRKNNAGYDLKQFWIGAEGTLGIITQAVLKLFPLPQYKSVLWAGLNNINDAFLILNQLQEKAAPNLSAFEIINQNALEKVLNSFTQLKSPFSQIFPWQALIELEFFEKNYTLSVENNALSFNLENIIIAQNEAEQKKLWQLREWISEAQKKTGKSIKHDIALPIFKIEEFLNKTETQLKKHFKNVDLTIFGHLGDGNLHYNVFLPEGLKYEKEVNEMVYENVLLLNGTISAEHGIGVLKKEWLLKTSPQKVFLMQQIKNVLDPKNIMNPGKVF